MPEKRRIGEILLDAEAGRLEKILSDQREPYDPVGSAEQLFHLLDERGVEYVLVGGLAMLQYVDGRNTRDVDLIVGTDAFVRMPELVVESKDREFARATFDGMQVDLLLADNPLFEHVRRHEVRTATFGSLSVQCATPRGMLLLKLFALPSLYRQGNTVRAAIYEADIAALLQDPAIDSEQALGRLAEHLLATDIIELRAIVDQIRERGRGFLPANDS